MSDRELVKARKIPLRVIGTFDELHTHRYAIEPTEENIRKLARRSVARQIVLGNMTKDELRMVLAMLGLSMIKKEPEEEEKCPS